MVKAFVFGKFLPFHKGHEAMVQFALTKCDFLTVLICCSDQENIPDVVREKWINETFQQYQNMEVVSLNYFEGELPNTSVSSEEVSMIWSQKFKSLFPDYEVVITSEDYGDFVAQFMGIRHIAFDLPKYLFPFSATAVRNDLFSNWNYLPDSVKKDLTLKVVLLGTESSGKSSLTSKLAKRYNCSEVQETARDIIPHSDSFSFDDLHDVANQHASRINKTVLGKSPLVIIDTDIHITKSYAQFVFGKELEVNEKIYNSNKANLYLYLNNNADYVQDGTRLIESDRNLLDFSHKEILKKHHIDYIELNGNYEQKFQRAVELINCLIKSDNKNYRLEEI